jgi:aldose 1-epimerase
MAMASFKAWVEALQGAGAEQIVLTDGARQTVKILPQMGSNLYSYEVDGEEMFTLPRDYTQTLGFGTPVLFPTPNRVTDCKFTFQGVEYPQHKNGQPKFLHGLVQDEPFSFDPPTADDASAQAVTYVDFEPGKQIYDSFPWKCRLTLTFTLTAEGLKLGYQVENFDEKPLPFGFAIHTYFKRVLPDEQIAIRVQCPERFEAVNLMPTGKILPTIGTDYDICSDFVSLDKLDLDDVFNGMDSSKTCEARYADGRHVTLRASDDFKKVVVFTPAGKPIFCMENQTCSTDAHNLYNRGLVDESSLIVLDSGAKHNGWITFTWTKD